MIHRGQWRLLAAATFFYLTSLSLLSPLEGEDRGKRADEPSSSIGKKVPDFKLPDNHGRQVSLGNFQDKKAVIVVFIGTECPINNAYMPRLVELDREFGPRGVQLLAVNSNLQDTPQRVADHARKHQLTFPILKDEDNRIADVLGIVPVRRGVANHVPARIAAEVDATVKENNEPRPAVRSV